MTRFQILVVFDIVLWTIIFLVWIIIKCQQARLRKRLRLPRRVIPTQQLALTDIPSQANDWSAIARFAATFDINHEHLSERNILGIDDISEGSSIVEMREALYVEWRRYKQFGRQPDKTLLLKAQKVIEWMRLKLQANTV